MTAMREHPDRTDVVAAGVEIAGVEIAGVDGVRPTG